MRLLALDIASTTGYAVFSNRQLTSYGSVVANKKSNLPYPQDVAYAAYQIASVCWNLCIQESPEIIVVEDTNPGGRANRRSQKMLEFVHAYFLEKAAALDVRYMSTRQWRDTILSIKLDDNDKAKNKKINEIRSKARKTSSSKKEERLIINKLKKEAGLSGKINKKHATIHWVNKIYGLSLTATQDDIADAIAIGSAFLKQ